MLLLKQHVYSFVDLACLIAITNYITYIQTCLIAITNYIAYIQTCLIAITNYIAYIQTCWTILVVEECEGSRHTNRG